MGIVPLEGAEGPRLQRPVDVRRFVEATGERMALLGREDGGFECWMWPLKLCRELRFRLLGAGESLVPVEREVVVAPGELALVERGSRHELVCEAFAARERRALVLHFRLASVEPLELEVSFRADLRAMWPAGLGGEVGRPDPQTGAYVLTEERGRFAALLGGAEGVLAVPETVHALPLEPVTWTRVLAPGDRTATFVVAGAELDPGPLSEAARRGDEQAATGFARAQPVVSAARELWRELARESEPERTQVRAHWQRVLQRAPRTRTPAPDLDEAFLWSQVALERAWVTVDGLGRGLVAGLAPSGGGARPGYGWFFDGDALAAARAFALTGDHDGAREVFRFASAHQREDGKLMHELTLSARLCDWLTEYPYAYYKGINAADFVAALDQYVALSGDLDLARESWGTVERALAWCAACTDADGRLSNERAGLAAVEAGELSERIASEVFLQGAWLAALTGGLRLAQLLGRDAENWHALCERAREGFEAFWSSEHGRYGFALLRDGGRCDDLTAYLGHPLARGFGRTERAWASVQALNRPELASDWGARMFATEAKAYDPRSYNTGAVFPYLTNFVTLAHYEHGNPLAGYQSLFSQVGLCHLGGLGLMEEHLEGARARIPERGVPHQVFSSAALVESTLAGLFGLAADAPAGRLTLRPSLPADWPFAAVEGLRVGATVLDVRFERERGRGSTRYSARLERRAGPPLEVAFAPRLAPLSAVVDGASDMEPSGCMLPRAATGELGQGLELALEVVEGPTLLLPRPTPVLGEESRTPRLVGQAVEGERVHWTLAGRAGTSASFGFLCDRPAEVDGAQRDGESLHLDFPRGEADWTEAQVTARLGGQA